MQSLDFVPSKHVLLELYDASNLTDIDFIEHALRSSAHVCGAKVLKVELHSFGENAGITGVALLAESHISIHTWPELGYAAVDIFMCGNCDPEKAIAPLSQLFDAKESEVKVCQRGQKLQVLSRSLKTA